MGTIRLSKIAKACCCVFLFYVIWFRYAYAENHIILYGSVFGALGCMAVDLLITRRDLLELCPTGVLMNLVMCAYSVITGLWVAVNQQTLISQAKTYATFSLLCVVICYVSGEEEKGIGWVVNTLIAANVVTAFYVIFRGYSVPGYGSVLGPGHNPNTLGLIMDVGLYCLAYRSAKRIRQVPLYLALAVLFLYVIVNTGSRKTLLAGGIITVLWLVPLTQKLWKRSGWGTRVLIIAVAAAAVSFAVYYFMTQYMYTDSYLRMRQLGDETEFSSRNRKLYYRYALDYFGEHPLFGIGLAQFEQRNPFRQMSHSTYAEALSDWGLVGSLLYFLPVLAAGRTVLRQSFGGGGDPYLSRILLALSVMELFLGIGQVWFYVIDHLITWTLIYYQIREEEKKREPAPRAVCRYLRA